MITTLQQYILQEQQEHFPEAAGRFSFLLSGITLATKMIQSKVRRAGLLDVLGAAGGTNVQGETQQKLDVYANDALLHCLGMRESVTTLVSEENKEPLTFDRDGDSAKYIVIFDPLDGSSNIDVNVSVGTIFSILRRPSHPAGDTNSSILQPGSQQVAAGYVVYGSSTILVYSAGQGVHGFTLDPSVGAYVLSHENMQMPSAGSIYSVNEAYAESFPEGYRRYLSHLKSGKTGRSYSARYIGSLVADFHRTLLKGGIFLYPPTKKQPGGKLRLLYEANPIAMLAEQAGGKAIDGKGRILDIKPEQIHQRTALVVGGETDMREFLEVAGGDVDARP